MFEAGVLCLQVVDFGLSRVLSSTIVQTNSLRTVTHMVGFGDLSNRAVAGVKARALHLVHPNTLVALRVS